jgi:hypothetical protein
VIRVKIDLYVGLITEMNFNFRFPIYHDGCDKCKNHFICFTEYKENKDIGDIYGSKNEFYYHVPFYIGLSCFKVEPYNYISHITLDIDHNGGMYLNISW